MRLILYVLKPLLLTLISYPPPIQPYCDCRTQSVHIQHRLTYTVDWFRSRTVLYLGGISRSNVEEITRDWKFVSVHNMKKCRM